MAVTTVTGSAAAKTLLVSTGTSVVAPMNTSTSLLQAANATITGSGTTALFLGRVVSDSDDNCQVEIAVDGTVIYGGSSGQQIIARTALTAAAHTVTFTAYALNANVNVSVAGLTIIDLGL